MKSGEPWKREFRGKKPCCAQPHGANLKQPRCKSKRRKWEFGDLHEGRRAERLLDQENSFGKGFYCTFVQLERFSWQIVLLRVLEGALVVVRTSFEEHSTSLFERGGLLFVFEGSFLPDPGVSGIRSMGPGVSNYLHPTPLVETLLMWLWLMMIPTQC